MKVLFNPRAIVAAVYDMELDEHVLIHGAGSQTRKEHSPEIDALASEYVIWFTRINNLDGPYCSAYNAAVTQADRR